MQSDLKLYNSMGRELQDFVPLEPGTVRLYTCGLTVYDYAHIGNLRAYLFTDSVRRGLQWKGYDVVHVMNITDVGHLTSDADEGDDKIEKAATKQQKSVWEITEHYTENFRENLVRLNILEPSVWCKATDHIQEMIVFARRLEEGGYVYTLEDGVYFDTSKVADYGGLALLDVEGLQEGARVAMTKGKRNATDFAVWKFSPPDKQRLMEWQSPWGKGAPGWHLECSAMSFKYLGHPFDIHTGGIDHRQVHHCNEIAQNQGYLASDDCGVRYWMHNEFLVFGDEKMSKSKGGILRLESLEEWGLHPLVYRYFALMTHYRKPLEFSLDALLAAKNGLDRLVVRIDELKRQADPEPIARLVDEARYSRGASFEPLLAALRADLPDAAHAVVEAVDKALSVDFNTPQVVAALANVLSSKDFEPAVALRLIAIIDLALGMQLLSVSSSDFNIRPRAATLSDEEVEAAIAEREAARAARDYATADRIRDELEQGLVELRDAQPGDSTGWRWLIRSHGTD